jgi:hypothetical protein
MAGEWFPVDVNLAEKPEVLEICELTGCEVEVVVYRLFRLWGWMQMHSADGNARVTLERFSKLIGCNAEFWKSVSEVGWLEIRDGEIGLPGWDERFSGAAKRRKMAAKRVQKHRNASVTQERYESVTTRQDITEQNRTSISARSRPADAGRSTPADSIAWDSSEGWQGISDADREAWGTAYPAVDIPQELARADQWLKANPTKAKRKAWRRFVTTWLSRTQDRGGSRTGQGQPAATPKESRKYWRAEFDRRMTDAEYAAAMRARKATGSVSLDLSRKLTAEVKHAS